MNTKTTFLKGLGVLTIIGVFGLVLGSSLISLNKVNADVVPASVSIIASPDTICSGQQARIAWTSVDAETSINQGIGLVLPFGELYVSPSVTTIYTITGTNITGGYAVASATVYVNSCSTPTPTPVVPASVSIIASPDTICSGQQARIAWTSVDATTLNINQSIGSVVPNGELYVSPSVTTIYTITGTNTTGGYAVASATVYVNSCSTPTPTPPTPTPTPTPVPSPIIALFTAAPAVCLGQSIDLVWNTVNASEATISPNIGSVPLRGDRLITPVRTTIYVLTATNTQGASATASTTVEVTGPCATPAPTPTPYPTYTPNPIIYSYLNISKMVRNITSNTSEVKSVNANVSDTVEFVIRVSAPNNQTATNVRVTDSLPYGLTYVTGSTTVDNSYVNDGITSNGISLGSFYSGRLATIRFRATVGQGYNYGNSTTTLTNSASVYADNASTVTDSASVIVGSNVIVNQNTLTILKTARNITRGDTTQQTSLSARAGDGIEFTIMVTAPYNTNLTNIVVSDLLPAGMNYTVQSTTLNNVVTTDGIVSNGLNIGSLSAGQKAEIKFYATINQGVAVNQQLVNTASARADNVSLVTSQPVYITIGNNNVIAGGLNVKTGPTEDAFALASIGGLMSSALYAARRKALGSLIRLA